MIVDWNIPMIWFCQCSHVFLTMTLSQRKKETNVVTDSDFPLLIEKLFACRLCDVYHDALSGNVVIGVSSGAGVLCTHTHNFSTLHLAVQGKFSLAGKRPSLVICSVSERLFGHPSFQVAIRVIVGALPPTN